MSKQQEIFGFTSHLNVPFIARRIKQDRRTIIKFYDARFPATEFGQVVSFYYAETFARIKAGNGLNLEGSEPSWTISANDVALVKERLLSAAERNCMTCEDCGSIMSAVTFTCNHC